MANDLFYGLLNRISGNKKLLQTIKHITTDHYKKNNKDQSLEVEKVDREIETYRNRLQNAQTLMLDGDLDAGEYRNIKSRLEPEIERLIRKQINLSEKNPEEQEVMEFGFYFLSNMTELFTEASLEAKHQIIGSMFPEKIVFENKELRTNPESGVLPLLINATKDFTLKKGKGSNNFDPSSLLVPLTGIEPKLTYYNQIFNLFVSIKYHYRAQPLTAPPVQGSDTKPADRSAAAGGIKMAMATLVGAAIAGMYV